MALFGRDEPHVRIEEMRNTTPVSIESVSAGVLGLVGDFSEGPTGEVRYVQSWSEFTDLYGDLRTDLAGPWELAGYYNQAASLPAYIVRVVGDGAAKASINLADASSNDTLTIEAWGAGEWGNELSVEVSDADTTSAGFFRLKIKRTDPDTGEYTTIDYGDVTMDSTSDYYAPDVVNAYDRWVAAEEHVSSVGDPPDNTVGFSSLSGGLTGSAPDDDDYDDTDTGGGLLDAVDEVTILRYAGRESLDANNNVIARAANLEDRIAICCISDATSPSNIADIVASLTASRYAMVVYGRGYVVNPINGGRKSILPGGHVAGHLAARPPHYSPAYGFLKGFIGTSRNLTPGQRETLTENAVSALVKEKAKVGNRKMNVFKLNNGLNLATQAGWSQISKIRKAMQLIESLDEGLQGFRSAPNTADYRSNLAAAIESLLAPEKRDGAIIDYLIDVSDELNPPTLQAQRIVRARVAIDYVDPGDYIWIQVDHNWNTGDTKVST